MWSKVGVWAFIVGIIIAVIIAIFTALGRTGNQLLPSWTIIVLALLGLVVGILNIGAGEVNTFLTATIAFIVASAALAGVFGQLGASWDWLQAFLGAIAIFASPAAIVVSFRAIWETAKSDED
jgi:hypothetical protein